MDTTEQFGETSRKQSSNEDTNRPLKKAKYLWQVKGKYHLKDNLKVLNSNSNDAYKNDTFSTKKGNSPNENNVMNEIEIHNNNTSLTRNKNLCNDRSCIEAILANSDKYMDFSLADSPSKNIDKSISDEIPITLVKPNQKTDDYYLRKWQARQIAKGFLDNTINRVLEHWMVAPFDAADFVENCDNGGQIEDEGILMAIQSHGLQSGIRDIHQPVAQCASSKSLTTCNTRNNWEAEANCTCSKRRTDVVMQSNSSALTPFHQRTEQNDFNLKYYENLCVLKGTEPLRTNFLPTESFPGMDESLQINSSLITSRIDDNIHGNNNTYDSLKINDSDFLDAAVAVAIQKKGLTSFNCVDCG